MDKRTGFQLLPKRWPGRWIFLAVGLTLTPILALVTGACFCSLPEALRKQESQESLRIEDRDGRLLREVRTSAGALSQWVPIGKMPPLLPSMLVAVEDRRFYYHPGVDPLSIARAAVHNVWRLRVVSGASTLAMQLARSLRPHRRTFWGKCIEMALALRIETSLPKRRILEEYLNRVDFGPNLRGIGAAAQAYFGKPVASLSLSEMALLVGMPQGPSVYALHRHPERAAARRNRVLQRAAEARLITSEQAAAARGEPLRFQQQQPAFGAPHLVTALLSGSSSILRQGLAGTEARAVSRVRTTIDSYMQRAAEAALAQAIPELTDHHVTAGAAVVIDNTSGEVLAYVGSPDFFDDERQGQVDGVRALRQPGSTLKPFVYAAAIGELDYTPATVLPDIPLTLTDDNGDEYTPRNFDDKYRGPVRLREALGNSLNVPAVYTASELGAPTLLRTLHGFGFDSLRRSPEYYGPALALGDGEVTLLELVRAYATLARSGNLLPLHAVLQWESRASPTSAGGGAVQSYVPPPGSTAISTVAATLVTDMLADNRARAATFGLESPIHFDVPVAAKTGTSKNYRDNWVLGYSKRVTVGVWVGNFDGSPMREVSGITGAGPVFRAIMASALTRYPDTEPLVPIEPQLSEPSAVWSAFPAAAHPHDDQELPATSGIRRLEICPFSGQRRGAQCPHGLEELVPSSAVLRDCEWHRRVAIDRRNGLLAGPSCPSSVVVEKQFEALPNLYRAWAKSEQRESAPDAYSPHCPAPATDGTAREQPVITEPASGARYVIDPERPARAQQLTVAVLAPASTHAIQLLLDGVALWYSTRPFEFQWVLQPGEHRFVARDMDGKQSEPVLVHVRTTGE